MVGHGPSGAYVVRILDQAARIRGYPRAVRTENGPSFTSRAFIARTQQHGIEHRVNETGKPMQNGDIESLNGKFRDERLNEHGLTSFAQAREDVAEWRGGCNEAKPHCSCRRIPPARLATNHRILKHQTDVSFKLGLSH